MFTAEFFCHILRGTQNYAQKTKQRLRPCVIVDRRIGSYQALSADHTLQLVLCYGRMPYFKFRTACFLGLFDVTYSGVLLLFQQTYLKTLMLVRHKLVKFYILVTVHRV